MEKAILLSFTACRKSPTWLRSYLETSYGITELFREELISLYKLLF